MASAHGAVFTTAAATGRWPIAEQALERVRQLEPAAMPSLLWRKAVWTQDWAEAERLMPVESTAQKAAGTAAYRALASGDPAQEAAAARLVARLPGRLLPAPADRNADPAWPPGRSDRAPWQVGRRPHSRHPARIVVPLGPRAAVPCGTTRPSNLSCAEVAGLLTGMGQESRLISAAKQDPRRSAGYWTIEGAHTRAQRQMSVLGGKRTFEQADI
jgi:hypothetical protein